jgi:predicted CoA-binding protein
MGSSLYLLNNSEKYAIQIHRSRGNTRGINHMQSLDTLAQTSGITSLLRRSRKIAIIGLSPKENRPSNMVGRYMVDSGFTIYPVNPGQSEIFGLDCYPDISAVPTPVDIVDIFRKSEDILPIVEMVVALPEKPEAIWMQQGIVNEEAAELARKNNIYVVMDRCIKVDHQNFLK